MSGARRPARDKEDSRTIADMQSEKTHPLGVTVVLPCLNEEGSIGQVIGAARKGIAKLGFENSEIIIVDNGSRDRSAQIAKDAGARLLHERNPGYGAALRRGFAAARYDIIVMGDSDMSYDFERLDELVRPILAGEADFVVGNRMKSIEPGAMPRLHRYLGNPVLSFILRAMFHTRSVHDAHCGMRAITRDAYQKLRCVTTGMEFASEMIIRAIRTGVRLAERDIVYHPRVGESKLCSFRDGWRHLRFMILHSPTKLMLVPGMVGWLLGISLVLWLAFGPVTLGERVVGIHSMIIGGLLNITSMQVLTIGLLAKAYGHLSGLHDDSTIAWFYRWFTFEKASVISGLVVLAGLAITAAVIRQWIKTDLGELDQPGLLILALVFLVNGVQMGAASFLFSIMALPRHIDHLTPEVEKTGVRDL